ncbi:MAG: aminopeptidase P N-terminal domain-containing protein [Ignavibacteriales bacterium]|nr:aminopeptidase P N-terminal domain-containing protein [Ignavibacteriales bacterium]
MSGRSLKLSFGLLLFPLLLLAQDFRFIEYDTDLIKPEVHKARREKLMEKLGKETIGIFYSAPERNRNWDVDYQYRQDDNFYYLTGFTEPNSILLLLPAGYSVRSMEDTSKMITVREILFVQPRDVTREQWNGRRYGAEGAVKLRGVDYAMTNDRFQATLPGLMFRGGARIVYVPTMKSDLTGDIAALLGPLKNMMEGRMGANVEWRDPTSHVRQMRIVKGPEEIEMLRKASEISAVAHNQAMMSVEPGMGEFELGGLYEYVFRRMGAEYAGYPCIVGSSENSVVLHYNTNRKIVRNGELVLADCAAEYHGYSSDVTRTYPVNGTFSKAQREIYQIVLDAQKAAIARIKPGVRWSSVSEAADSVIMDGLVQLGLMKERTRPEMRKFYMHGLGHPVGLNVHDVGQQMMEPGMLYTVEPGIYISENISGVPAKYHDIGVRIEDVILVTPEGNKNLSESSPREINDIERMMKKRGIGNQPLR